MAEEKEGPRNTARGETGDEDEIRAWGSDNVNNRAIAVRLHAQMIYNNNDNMAEEDANILASVRA